MESDRAALLDQWHRRVTLTQLAHYEAARRARRFQLALDLVAAVIPLSIGAALLGVTGSPLGASIVTVLGSASLVASALAILNTLLRFTARADLHLAAARQYAQLRRMIEERVAMSAIDGKVPERLLAEIREHLTSLGREDPPLPSRIWQRLEQQQELQGREALRRARTQEESIVAALQAYGALPVDFLGRLQGLTQGEVLSVVENLRRQGLVDVKGDTILLLGRGDRGG